MRCAMGSRSERARPTPRPDAPAARLPPDARSRCAPAAAIAELGRVRKPPGSTVSWAQLSASRRSDRTYGLTTIDDGSRRSASRAIASGHLGYGTDIARSVAAVISAGVAWLRYDAVHRPRLPRAPGQHRTVVLGPGCVLAFASMDRCGRVSREASTTGSTTSRSATRTVTALPQCSRSARTSPGALPPWSSGCERGEIRDTAPVLRCHRRAAVWESIDCSRGRRVRRG